MRTLNIWNLALDFPTFTPHTAFSSHNINVLNERSCYEACKLLDNKTHVTFEVPNLKLFVITSDDKNIRAAYTLCCAVFV